MDWDVSHVYCPNNRSARVRMSPKQLQLGAGNPGEKNPSNACNGGDFTSFGYCPVKIYKAFLLAGASTEWPERSPGQTTKIFEFCRTVWRLGAFMEYLVYQRQVLWT